MRNLADDAAAGGQHAGDENDALDQRHPLAETGQLLLHGDDHQGAHQRTEYRSRSPTSAILKKFNFHSSSSSASLSQLQEVSSDLVRIIMLAPDLLRFCEYKGYVQNPEMRTRSPAEDAKVLGKIASKGRQR
jgi:hypothetical protein